MAEATKPTSQTLAQQFDKYISAGCQNFFPPINLEDPREARMWRDLIRWGEHVLEKMSEAAAEQVSAVPEATWADIGRLGEIIRLLKLKQFDTCRELLLICRSHGDATESIA